MKRCLILAVLAGAALAGPVFDPAQDDPAKPWSYFGQTTTLIGVPFMPDAIQVTYDGALFTRQAELCFFIGEPARPFFDRQKQWLDGWIPVVQARDQQDGIRYELELFTVVPRDEDVTNTVQLIRMRMTNTGAVPAQASLLAAARGSGGDYRLGGVSLPPTTRFEMTDDALWRDGKLIYAFPPGGRREAVPGEPYVAPFAAHAFQVSARAEAGGVRYTREQKPGERWELVFRMPRVPTADPAKLAQLGLSPRTNAAGGATLLSPKPGGKSAAAPSEWSSEQSVRDDPPVWEAERARAVDYWTGLVGRHTRLTLPEKRLEQAHRAATAHVLLGTRTFASGRTQTDGLPYPMLFIICLWDYQMLYDSMGLGAFYEVNLPHLRARQLEDGMLLDTSLTHGKRIMSSHGPTLFSVTHHIVMTRDRGFASNVWPLVRKAVDCIRIDHENDPKGLVRPSWPYDAEMISGYYASHNYWTLAALRSATRAARLVGASDDAAAWLKLHDTYEKAVKTAIDASTRPGDWLPTGFYDFITGPAARAGFAEYQTDQDYDNLMTAWPTEALRPDDRRVMATFHHVRDLRYREGILTYRNGQHLHQYATVKNTMQALVAGADREFLRDAYHILAHSGSTHESFENLIEPWTTRTPQAGCPPPHVWGCSKMALLIRSMVVMEYGGRGGLDPDQRELRLFNAIPAGWAKPGQRAAVDEAITEFGTVDASLTFRADGADLAVKPDFHTPPARLVLRVPYWAEFQRLESAGGSVSNGWIFLPAGATSARLFWKPKPDAHDGTWPGLLSDYRRERGFWPGKRSEAPPLKPVTLTDAERGQPAEPLSFDLVTRALDHEFATRLSAGGTPWIVKPPPLLTEAERAKLFGNKWDAATLGIAVGKPATASATSGDYDPARAVDGDAAHLLSSWQADPYPQWWQVDLGKTVSVNRIHVFPYWGLNRSYQYTVEASADGTAWQRVADLSENTEPATPAGNDFRFQPVAMRFVRVNMLKHSLNAGVHLVEVRVFPAK
jgi:hypothetical protein